MDFEDFTTDFLNLADRFGEKRRPKSETKFEKVIGIPWIL